MSKRPLRMRCPLCGGYGSHPVVKTQSTLFCFDHEIRALIERFTGKELSYRSRCKECAFCKRNFYTVEMSHCLLTAMITTIKQMQLLGLVFEPRGAEADQLRKRVVELEHQLAEARHSLEAAKEKWGRIIACALEPLSKEEGKCVAVDAKR